MEPKGKKRMKKVFALVLFAVFGTYVVNAQDESEREVKKEKTEVKSDGTVKEKDEVVTAKTEEKKKKNISLMKIEPAPVRLLIILVTELSKEFAVLVKA